jgi:MFS family permease
MSEKWRSLGLLAFAELLAMGPWFSASAVVPQLTRAWTLDGSQSAWLTMSVQLGFVAGALLSALLNLPDRVALRLLISACAVSAALLNGAIALLVDTPGPAIVLRFLTGMSLAGVYPPGMKLVATWCREDRGLGIGLLVGALTVGKAVPHLLNAIPLFGGAEGIPPWRPVLLSASALALAAALLAGLFVRPGPHHAGRAPFDWRHAGRPLTERAVRLANFGYLGHMWELYAMWTWAPLFLLHSYQQAGWSEASGRLAGFAVVAAGGAGCVVAGLWADRWGRTLVASVAMAVSGCCALAAGWLGAAPGWATVVCLIWGIAVVADSAQFSAAISELSDRRYVGTALTVQTSLGFLLTLVTIRIVPPLVEEAGWASAFTVLALGPLFGIASMLRLRRLPEARSMASGHR